MFSTTTVEPSTASTVDDATANGASNLRLAAAEISLPGSHQAFKTGRSGPTPAGSVSHRGTSTCQTGAGNMERSCQRTWYAPRPSVGSTANQVTAGLTCLIGPRPGIGSNVFGGASPARGSRAIISSSRDVPTGTRFASTANCHPADSATGSLRLLASSP